jgi:hypothetical protein
MKMTTKEQKLDITKVCCPHCKKHLIDTGLYLIKYDISFYASISEDKLIEYKIRHNRIVPNKGWKCKFCDSSVAIGNELEEDKFVYEILLYRKEHGIKEETDEMSDMIDDMLDNKKEKQLAFHFIIQGDSGK